MDVTRDPLLVVTGPTATGKTSFAIELAERLGAEILSCDSQQVYAGMEVGTAQPTSEECARVRHHLFGFVDPAEHYEVARYVRDAGPVLDRLAATGKPAIACGGTGLFIRHLLHGIFRGAPRDEAVRAELEARLAAEGLEALRAELRSVDPARDAQINPNDSVRVVRALEVYRVTGTPMSEHHRRDAAARATRPHAYLVVDRDRDHLARRIESRTATMLDGGWIEETEALAARGLDESTKALKAHGYREILRYLRGELSRADVVAEINRQVRAYSKRQRTWHRAVESARWINLDAMSHRDALALATDIYRDTQARTRGAERAE